ncbi:DMT family transporter [Desulfovibrio subterraneus]|uniref:DMT family transporter n=1 Tax=Desulfovibrio subterraneus TaxID=2718620 RepID=UPI0022B8899F|nr:DMT family transporter [Desulfovibrio subterraneus]WBF68545.1 DMT family transporter [Desulfovibrio subterraneus]
MKGYAFVLLAASMWALLGPVAKFGLAAGMTPLELAFWRAASGTLLFGIHARRTGTMRARPKDIPVFLMFGCTGVALFFGSYQLAVQGAGAALASILLYTAPAWVALLSRLLFGEPLSRMKTMALGLAMCGAGLVCLSGGIGDSVTTAGILFGLLSGFTYSLHYIFGKTYLETYSSVTLYMWSLPAGALALLPWVEFTPPTPTGIAVILVLGVVCTYGAYYAYCEGLKRLEATRVAVIANAEPVLAALLALWWWDELLSPLGYFGGALVLGAVMLIVFDRPAVPSQGSSREDEGSPACAPAVHETAAVRETAL